MQQCERNSAGGKTHRQREETADHGAAQKILFIVCSRPPPSAPIKVIMTSIFSLLWFIPPPGRTALGPVPADSNSRMLTDSSVKCVSLFKHDSIRSDQPRSLEKKRKKEKALILEELDCCAWSTFVIMCLKQGIKCHRVQKKICF